MKLWRSSILVIFNLIFNSITCMASTNENELKLSEKGNYKYNPNISEQYNAEVYGDPFSEEGFFVIENGGMYYDGQWGEHQYLGYNFYEKKYPNDKWFRKQSYVGSLFDENYTGVMWQNANPDALQSWEKIDKPDLIEYMKTALFYDSDHPTAGKTNTGKSIYDLFGEEYQNYAIVINPPSEESNGHILCYYKKSNSSKLHYNTLIIKPIPGVECIMTADSDITSIPSGETRDIKIRVDTGESFWTLYGEKYHEFTKREYWVGIGDVKENEIVENTEGVYTFTIGNVSPGTTITIWSKVYSDELKTLGYEYAAEAMTSIYIGEKLPPQPNAYDLDYNILSRKIRYPLSDTAITAKLILPRGNWDGNAWGNLNVTNESPNLLQNFTVTNNPPVNADSSEISRNPEINATIHRRSFGDDPENKGWINLPNPLIPETETGEVSYGGTVYRNYEYTYDHSNGCQLKPGTGVEGKKAEYYCPGHTGSGTADAQFDSGTNTKTVRAFIYNGMPDIPSKQFENKISNNSIYSESKNIYWKSELYKLDVIRWMYHMDENGNLINPTRVDGQYQRTFTQQCSAGIDWYIGSSMEQNYARSRRAALNRDYRKSESDKAVFASDIEFKYVDYPIKSGYYFNPCGSYEFTVETVTYKTSPADTKEHKDLVDALIKAFRYETDLMYINSDKIAVNIQNEALPRSRNGNSYERQPAALTAEDPTGVDDIVLLEVFDRDRDGSRYTKTVEELYHSEDPSGNTHKYLKEIMEGYRESGTSASDTNYKYKEYIKDGQHIYKITEKTRVTITINLNNRNVYTHVHMPDGDYYVRVWVEDIDLSETGNLYNTLGVLKGISRLDEIDVTVKGSLYDDVDW